MCLCGSIPIIFGSLAGTIVYHLLSIQSYSYYFQDQSASHVNLGPPSCLLVGVHCSLVQKKMSNLPLSFSIQACFHKPKAIETSQLSDCKYGSRLFRFDKSDFEGRFWASVETEIEAACVGECMMFWLCLEIGRNKSVREPFS